MTPTLAFDVYGTLIDTHGVVERLTGLTGDTGQARSFSQAWRDKQLEYTFRRGLMQRYANFTVCTRDALDYVCQARGLDLDDGVRSELLDIYRQLPAFDDAVDGLEALNRRGVRCYAFSNGVPEGVDGLLRHAGIRDRFLDIVSVDEIESFKPDPAVYRHFLSRADTTAANAWLISSNPFDIIGALEAGMRAAWVQRDPAAVFDPWGIEPTATVSSLLELPALLGDSA